MCGSDMWFDVWFRCVVQMCGIPLEHARDERDQPPLYELLREEVKDDGRARRTLLDQRDRRVDRGRLQVVSYAYGASV
jgi:hypothetical protein